MVKRTVSTLVLAGLVGVGGLAGCAHRAGGVTAGAGGLDVAGVPGSSAPASGVPGSSAPAGSVPVGGCPAAPPKMLTLPGAGPHEALVPAGAVTLLLCRYSAFDGGLTAQRLIADQPTVRSWQARFDALKAVPAGTYNCPMDDGSSIVAKFVATSGSSTLVRVDLRGCRWVRTATSARSSDASLIRDLEQLTPGKS